MLLKSLMIFALISSCTLKNNQTAAPQSGPKSCSDYTSLNECLLDGKCSSEYGHDAATAEEFYMACRSAYVYNPDCYGERTCYTNSSGQRAIARKCDYARWTEVACTAEELAPCQYTTVAPCEADKRCTLNMAKDLATKESIPMGCGYINGYCSHALTCYTSKLTGARVLASSICRTPFPEWESTPCTEADYEAARAP